MSSENIIGLRRFPAINHRHSGQKLKTRYVYFESRGRAHANLEMGLS